MDGSIYDDRVGVEEDATMPLGKEPQLWEFARDVVTSLVSDLAVVSGRAWGAGEREGWRECICFRGIDHKTVYRGYSVPFAGSLNAFCLWVLTLNRHT